MLPKYNAFQYCNSETTGGNGESARNRTKNIEERTKLNFICGWYKFIA